MANGNAIGMASSAQSRNPQKFVPSIYDAKADDFVIATQRIYHSREHPSRVTLPVVK